MTDYEEQYLKIAESIKDIPDSELKAPNGKKSNLSRHQWIQVRTDAFMRWFGDWELANLFRFANSSLVDKKHKGKLLFSMSPELSSELKKILGHKVSQIEISANSIRHINKRHGIGKETISDQLAITTEDIACLPYILNNFDIAEWDKAHDKDGKKAVKVIKRINGIAVVATIEKGNGNQAVVTNWHKMSVNAMTSSLTSPQANARSGTDMDIVKHEIAEIKNNIQNVSKVVDENGEPLVVYHGTKDDIEIFDHNKGIKNDPGWLGKAFYFTSRKSLAESYSRLKSGDGAEKVMEVFLNLRNPHQADLSEKKQGQQGNSSEYAQQRTEDLRTQGYDGVLFFTPNNSKYSDNSGYEFAVFSPNQIKSATHNRGAFNKDDNNIYDGIPRAATINAVCTPSLVKPNTASIDAKLKAMQQPPSPAKPAQTAEKTAAKTKSTGIGM